MTDCQQRNPIRTQSDPHGSHGKMSHVLLTHLPPRCVLTFSPLPKGQPVRRLRAPPSKELKQHVYKQKEEGSQNKFKSRIPEGQEHAPRLEPTAPIRLAYRNHAHDPSRQRTILKKRRLDDGLPAHANRSTRESSEDVTRTLDAPPYKVRSDFFPHSPKCNQSDG